MCGAVNAPARNLVYGLALFAASLGMCIAMTADGVIHNHGWSFYGSNDATLVPYAFGFVGCCAFFWRAAAMLAAGGADDVATGVRLLVGFLLLDLLTPDSLNAFFYWAHVAASVLLFLFEFAFAAALAFRMMRSTARAGAARMLFGAQFAGGLLAMLSQLEIVPALSEGMVVFQAAFGAVLVLAANSLRAALPPAPAPQLAGGEARVADA
jgi:hypothetical protein